MTANEIARKKYQSLMAEVDALEEQIVGLTEQPKAPERSRQIEQIQEKLAERRTELARISDGCGTPHAK